MTESSLNRNQSRRLKPLGLIFTVLGLLLFAYFVRKAGVGQIVEGIRRLGAGFLLVLLISGVRKVVRALAWTRCFEEPYRLGFWDGFKAIVMGEALGNMTSLNMVVSEPAKAALVRRRVPLAVGLSAITIENLFYSLSVALFIFSGMAALLLSFSLPKPLRIATTGALIGVVVVVLLAYLFVRRQWKFLSGALQFFYARGIGRRWLEKAGRERVRAFEERVYGFYARHRRRFLPILLLELCFHLAGVIEGYVTLHFISDMMAPTFLAAFIFESVNRVINVVFKPIPMRAGVDEAGTGLFAKILGFGTASGVTLAIIRKARDICWTLLGLALLARRGLSLSEVAPVEGDEPATKERSAQAAIPAREI